MEKKLIVYCSHTGTTCRVAEQMAAQDGWQLVGATDEHPCAGFLGDICCALEAVFRARTKRRYEGPPLDNAEHAIMIAPIWMDRLVSSIRDPLANQLSGFTHLSVICVVAACGAFCVAGEIIRITAIVPTPVLALLWRDVLSGLSQEEIAGFIEQVEAVGRWEQSRRRPA